MQMRRYHYIALIQTNIQGSAPAKCAEAPRHALFSWAGLGQSLRDWGAGLGLVDYEALTDFPAYFLSCMDLAFDRVLFFAWTHAGFSRSYRAAFSICPLWGETC